MHAFAAHDFIGKVIHITFFVFRTDNRSVGFFGKVYAVIVYTVYHAVNVRKIDVHRFDNF